MYLGYHISGMQHVGSKAVTIDKGTDTKQNVRMESKRKEPKAPRTTLRGTKPSLNQHTNTTHSIGIKE
jgi:hypothetical protein